MAVVCTLSCPDDPYPLLLGFYLTDVDPQNTLHWNVPIATATNVGYLLVALLIQWQFAPVLLTAAIKELCTIYGNEVEVGESISYKSMWSAPHLFGSCSLSFWWDDGICC